MIEPMEPATVEEFKRHTAAKIEHLRETGRPQILMVGGEATLVVQDIASYQKFLDRLDYAEALEGIRLGLEETKRGEAQPLDVAFAELRAELGLPPKE